MTAKRPVGRPRTTVDDLPENWRDIMIECGREGGSETEMRVLLGIGKPAWYTLCEDSEEFQEAKKMSKDLCEVWWERRGRQMAKGEDGNSTVWIFNMKNRFNWRDKQEVDQTVKADLNHSGSISLSKEEIKDIGNALEDDC